MSTAPLSRKHVSDVLWCSRCRNWDTCPRTFNDGKLENFWKPCVFLSQFQVKTTCSNSHKNYLNVKKLVSFRHFLLLHAQSAFSDCCTLHYLILNITKHRLHVCSPVPHRNALAGQLAMILHMLSRLTQHWRRIEETCDLWHCANCTQHSRDIFSSNLSIPRRPGLSPSRCTVGRGTKWDHASYHLLQSPRMGTRRHF